VYKKHRSNFTIHFFKLFNKQSSKQASKQLVHSTHIITQNIMHSASHIGYKGQMRLEIKKVMSTAYITRNVLGQAGF